MSRKGATTRPRATSRPIQYDPTMGGEREEEGAAFIPLSYYYSDPSTL